MNLSGGFWTNMMVFDDHDESWRASSLALKRALHSPIAGPALANYSVINIGFVAAGQAQKSVHIRVRPAVASGAAVASLFYWLYSQSSIERVVISCFEEMAWSHALVGSREAAVDHLGVLLASRRVGA